MEAYGFFGLLGRWFPFFCPVYAYVYAYVYACVYVYAYVYNVHVLLLMPEFQLV